MQDQQVRPRAGCDRVGATLLVAELYEQSLVVKLLDDRADLTARKSLRGKVCQQRHHVQKRWPFVLCALIFFHHSTQHVTNVGTFSPVRTIQIVLTTALFPCRRMVASRRQWLPHASVTKCKACPERGFEQNVSQPRRIAPLQVERLAKYPSLVSAARVRGTQTIVLELTNIEDCPIGVGQTPCHAGAETLNHKCLLK